MKHITKRFGGSVLFVASLFMLNLFFSCNNPQGSSDETLPKFPVTWRVDPEGSGSIVATVDGKTIESGAMVEKGKTVEFTLTINDETKHKLLGWSNAKQSDNNDKVATKKITKAVEVVASLDNVIVEKYTLKFDVEPKGCGVVTAKDGERALTSGEDLAKGTKIVFTLNITNPNFELDTWEGAQKDSNNQVTATMQDAPLTVTAKLKKKQVKLTFVVSPSKAGKLTATKSDGSPVTSGDMIEAGTTILFKGEINQDETERYELAGWENADPTSGLMAKKVIPTEDITVVFNLKLKEGKTDPDAKYRVAFGTVPADKGKVTATIQENGKEKEIQSGDEVKTGVEVTFKVKLLDKEYVVEDWEGVGVTVPNYQDKTTAKLTVDKTSNVTAKLKHILPPAKITSFKIQKVSDSSILYTATPEDLEKAMKEWPYLEIKLPKGTTEACKFIITTDPQDAKATWSDADVKPEGKGKVFTKNESNITIKVGKFKEYKDVTYTFRIKVEE